MSKIPNVLSFDLETTGLERDSHIVSIAMMSKSSSDKTMLMNTLIHPRTEIPQSATNIHKISDETVKNAYPLSHFLEPICNAIINADIITGYNILRFDIPVLVSNLKREVDIIYPDRKSMASKHYHNLVDKTVFKLTNNDYKVIYIDVYEIVKDYIKDVTPEHPDRKLGTVYNRIFNETLNAHDAQSDLDATLRLLNFFKKSYSAKKQSISMFGKSAMYVEGGQIMSQEQFSTYRLTFGKFNGLTLEELSAFPTGRSYLQWMVNSKIVNIAPNIMKTLVKK